MAPCTSSSRSAPDRATRASARWRATVAGEPGRASHSARRAPGDDASTRSSTIGPDRKLACRNWPRLRPIWSLRAGTMAVWGIGTPERVAEQGGDREPVGQAADHRRLGRGPDVADPGRAARPRPSGRRRTPRSWRPAAPSPAGAWPRAGGGARPRRPGPPPERPSAASPSPSSDGLGRRGRAPPLAASSADRSASATVTWNRASPVLTPTWTARPTSATQPRSAPSPSSAIASASSGLHRRRLCLDPGAHRFVAAVVDDRALDDEDVRAGALARVDGLVATGELGRAVLDDVDLVLEQLGDVVDGDRAAGGVAAGRRVAVVGAARHQRRRARAGATALAGEGRTAPR